MAHYNPDFVPVVAHGVLDTDRLVNSQLGQGIGVTVASSSDICGPYADTTVTLLGLGLPFLKEGLWVGRDT